MMHRSKKLLSSGDQEYFNEKRPVNARVDATAHHTSPRSSRARGITVVLSKGLANRKQSRDRISRNYFRTARRFVACERQPGEKLRPRRQCRPLTTASYAKGSSLDKTVGRNSATVG
jgi:hypothetical protein